MRFGGAREDRECLFGQANIVEKGRCSAKKLFVFETQCRPIK